MTDTIIQRITRLYNASQRNSLAPLRWRINNAAARELLADPDFNFRDDPRPLEKRVLFGAAITVIDDGEEQPTFFLNSEPAT